jgi:hypothetical protein
MTTPVKTDGDPTWIKLCETAVHLGAALALFQNALDKFKKVHSKDWRT